MKKIRATETSSGNHITKGRVYEVLAEDTRYYSFISDAGREASVWKHRFEVIEEAPAAAMILPSDPQARKDIPITTGVLDYFPLALAEVAIVSKAGNDQHNPGQPLHWAKGKSTDHADCIPRHLIDRHTRDTDGMRHSAKLAWRALALLQTELEAEAAARG